MAEEGKLSGGAVKKLGSYSYCSIKKINSPKKNNEKKKCFLCGWFFKPNHIKKCNPINSNCLNSIKDDHFAKSCGQQKTIIDIEDKGINGANSNENDSQNETYQYLKLS